VKQAALKPESGALGSWAGALITTTGESLPFPFHLHRHGDEYSGGMTSDAARGEFMDIAVSGNHVTFVLRTERESVHFDLKLDGDEMAGTAVETSNGKETKYRLSAVRRM
jgi:hypothetical protein